MNEHIAFIINAERNGLGIARSLGEIGVQAVFVDNCPTNVGFASKYCIGRIIDFKSKEGLLKRLIEKTKGYDTKPVLFAASDEGVLFMNENQEQLKAHFLFNLPSMELTHSLVNKEAMYKLAQEYNVTIPKTFFLENEQIEGILQQVTFPCILKPQFSHLLEKEFGTRIIRLSSREDFEKIYKKIKHPSHNFMLQEIIEGADNKIWFFGGYFDRNSVPLTYFTGRKIRQCPIEFGSTSMAEYAHNVEVERESIQFLRTIGFKGLCDVEFKQGKDGKFYLMEVNPRAGLWHRLGNFIGKDIVQTYYLDLIGKAYTPGKIMTKGKWMAEDRDIISAVKYARKGKLRVSEWFRSLLGRKIFSLWDIKDPKPFFYYFFVSLPQYLRKKHLKKHQAESNKNIAYIISQFPETHETFILREIIQAKRNNIDISIFSLKHCRDKIVHPAAAALMQKTVYPKFALGFIFANLYFLISRPMRYLKALCYILQRNISSREYTLKSLYVFPISIYFARIIWKRRIKHIHAHWITMPATSAIIISKILDIPFSITAHAWDIYVPHPMLKEKLRLAKFVLTCTDFNRRYLSGLDNQHLDGRVILNYHGLDTQEFSPGERKPNQKFTILSIGRLYPHKGFDYLIEACSLLQKKELDFTCLIVGEGIQQETLENKIKEHHLENYVQLEGIKTQQEIKKLYQTCDLFVLACLIQRSGARDGIPNVILEAFSSELPAVSTNISGLPEVIIPNQTGLLVPQRDSRALAAAIEYLYQNRPLLREMGKKCRALVQEKFDIHKNTRELVEIFENRVFN